MSNPIVTNNSHPWMGQTVPGIVEFTARFDSPEEAAEFASRWPKSHGWKSGPSNVPGNSRAGWASTSSRLDPDLTNGGVNETGLRRYRLVLKALVAAGIEIEWVTPFQTSYKSREEFEAAAEVVTSAERLDLYAEVARLETLRDRATDRLSKITLANRIHRLRAELGGN